MRRALALVLAQILTYGSVAVAGTAPGAQSCFACHPKSPARAKAIGSLAGLSVADIAERLKAYKTGASPSTVMGRIAKGFSDEELDHLALAMKAKP